MVGVPVRFDRRDIRLASDRELATARRLVDREISELRPGMSLVGLVIESDHADHDRVRYRATARNVACLNDD